MIEPTLAGDSTEATTFGPIPKRGSEMFMSKAIQDMANERERQIVTLGYGSNHDDEHDAGDLATAGAAYALHAACVINPHSQGEGVEGAAMFWPWETGYKPDPDPRTCLVKAAALILSEIDRMDRKAKR